MTYVPANVPSRFGNYLHDSLAPSTGDWMDAALLDLEARKAKIDAMIEHIRELQAPGAPATCKAIGR